MPGSYEATPCVEHEQEKGAGIKIKLKLRTKHGTTVKFSLRRRSTCQSLRAVATPPVEALSPPAMAPGPVMAPSKTRGGEAVKPPGAIPLSRKKLGLVLIIAGMFLVSRARGEVVHKKWDISYQQYAYPDGARTIHAVQGDTVVVKGVNSSASGASYNATHPGCSTPVFGVVPGRTYRFRIASMTSLSALNFEIEQIGTPWADGTKGVTQCPILPGDTFEYGFLVECPGTYMYHAHYGMQRSLRFNGTTVVAVPPGTGPDLAEPSYHGEDEDRVFLKDWWRKRTYEQATGLASVPLAWWVGELQSLVINGRGRFVNCSALGASACNATHPEAECSTPMFAVVHGRTYRFRIGSMTSLSALNFEIEGHPMMVVEMDGHYVKPLVVRNINIYSGEPYSVRIATVTHPAHVYIPPPRSDLWHLHGHNFWVLGYGVGRSDPVVHTAAYNPSDPIFKNTVAHGAPLWVDGDAAEDRQPSVWVFRCHI